MGADVGVAFSSPSSPSAREGHAVPIVQYNKHTLCQLLFQPV